MTSQAHRNERHGWLCRHADYAVKTRRSILWCLRTGMSARLDASCTGCQAARLPAGAARKAQAEAGEGSGSQARGLQVVSCHTLYLKKQVRSVRHSSDLTQGSHLAQPRQLQPGELREAAGQQQSALPADPQLLLLLLLALLLAVAAARPGC